MQALSAKEASAEELAQIRQILDEVERGRYPMSGFQAVLSHPFLNALGWALFHFIWQGAAGRNCTSWSAVLS